MDFELPFANPTKLQLVNDVLQKPEPTFPLLVTVRYDSDCRALLVSIPEDAPRLMRSFPVVTPYPWKTTQQWSQ
jgi:hypothetical protein